MSRVTLCLLFCIGCLKPACQVVSKPPQGFAVHTITVDDGLPQGWIFDMAQDAQGFIWIASIGLTRYDGRSFKNFRHVDVDTSTIASNGIFSLQMASDSILWIQYDNGLVDNLNTITGHVSHLHSLGSYSKLLSNKPYQLRLVKVINGRYFLGIEDHLCIFNPATGSEKQLILPAGETKSAMGANAQGQTLIATTKALYVVKNNTVRLLAAFPIFSDDVYKSWEINLHTKHEPVGSIASDNKGDIICPGPGGVFIYAIGNKVSFFKDAAATFFPYVYTFNSKAYVLLSTGLFLFEDDSLKPVVGHNLSVWHSMKYPFLIDRSGVFWEATNDATGLILTDLSKKLFPSFHYTNGFSHDILQPWLHNPLQAKDYSSYDIRYAKDGYGNIWVTCPGLLGSDGKFDFEEKLIQLRHNKTLITNFKGANVKDFVFEKGTNCWLEAYFGENNRFLLKGDAATGQFTKFCHLPLTQSINKYLVAIGGRIAVVDETRIGLYDTITAGCKTFTTADLHIQSILLMAIPDPANRKRLWVATQEAGILLLDIETGKTVRFNEATGLPDNCVYGIMPDNHGYFWCSSNKGIFRFNPATGVCNAFTSNDGLPGNEFNRYHFLPLPGGRFAFGGPSGYTVFNPDSVTIDTYQPPVFVSDVVVNNSPLGSLPDYKNVLVSGLNSITLAHDENFLALHFAAPQYNAPAKIQYRYTLQGFDKGWVNTGNYATANYTFIPPGHYTFKVNATNTAGKWSSYIKTIEIEILPPWFKTWWAYALYICGITAMLYIIYINWLSRLKTRQALLLQQKEAEQLKVLDEMKDRFFGNITHEFRTPLSLIIGPAGQMRNGEPNAEWKSKAQMIYRSAQQMLQIINQLLDVAKLRANSMAIALSRGALHGFVQDVVQPFEMAASAKGILLTVNNQLSNDEYLFDAEKLQTILHNLLSNAIKFTPHTGTITVTAHDAPSSDEDIIFTIQDTGIGIPAAKRPFIFNRFYMVDDSTTRQYGGTGIGLALVKELTELMKGNITVASTPGEGSSFTVQLTFKKADGAIAPSIAQTFINNNLLVAHQNGANSVDNKNAPLILIAEDNSELNNYLVETFGRHYKVIAANNGADALDIAKRELPDIILSDLMMPGIDGYALCQAIKAAANTSHITFILLTAKASASSKLAGLAYQADDYITKPFIVDELLLRVQNIIKRQEILRAYYKQQLFATEQVQTAPLALHETQNEFLQILYGIIDTHLDDTAFDVDMLATNAAVSTRTLNRKLSAIIGLSASELIKQHRLNKAAEFLVQGNNVTEAAYKTGFESPAYFSTVFKSKFGKVPSAYKYTAEGKQG